MLVFGPRGIPASYRTMQGFGVNTYKWVNEAGETVLVKYHWHPKQGVKSWTEDDAAAVQGEVLGVHTKDLYDAIAAGRLPRVGPVRADHERRRAPRARLRPARRHQDLAGERLPAAPRRPHGARPRAEELLRRVRADRVRHRRAGRRAGLLRRQDARRAHVLLQRHAAPPGRPELPAAAGQRAEEARRDQPARRRDDLLRRRDRRRTRPSTTSRRSRAACSEAPKPGARRAGPGDRGAPHAAPDPAHERLPAGRRALPALRAVGARRPRHEPHRAARPVRPPDPGADDLAPVHDRGRARPAGRRGHRHLGRRRARPGAARDADADRGGARARREPRQQRHARRRAGSS